MLTKTSPSRGKGSPDVTGFYDEPTGSVQYLVSDPATKKAAIIDAVADFDHRNAGLAYDSAREILSHADERGLEIEWVLDTHPHADHAMASHWLVTQTGAPNAIGEKASEIAVLWRDYYNMPGRLEPDRHFARLFADGDTFTLGDRDVRVMLSPGHTLGSITYVIGDAAFVHDTFMHVDVGTSRADFPGGSADTLYDSLMDILKLPDETRLFVGHDYGTKSRNEAAWESTVAEQRANNPHVGGGATKSEFVTLRGERDATLPLPDRMLHVLQMNLRAGKPPEPEADGNAYLKIPVNRFGGPRR